MQERPMHQPIPAVTRHDFIETASDAERVLVVVFLRGGKYRPSILTPSE